MRRRAAARAASPLSLPPTTPPTRRTHALGRQKVSRLPLAHRRLDHAVDLTVRGDDDDVSAERLIRDRLDGAPARCAGGGEGARPRRTSAGVPRPRLRGEEREADLARAPRRPARGDARGAAPREDRDLDAGLFPGFVGANLRTSITRACKATGTPQCSPAERRQAQAGRVVRSQSSLSAPQPAPGPPPVPPRLRSSHGDRVFGQSSWRCVWPTTSTSALARSARAVRRGSRSRASAGCPTRLGHLSRQQDQDQDDDRPDDEQRDPHQQQPGIPRRKVRHAFHPGEFT
jgi:hypothetical protein